MNTNKISKLGIAMAATALVVTAMVYPNMSMADRRLKSWVSVSSPGAPITGDCYGDRARGNVAFMSEAIATQAFGFANCQLTSAGSTATTSCLLGDKHRAQLTSFDAAGNLQYPYGAASAWSASWTNIMIQSFTHTAATVAGGTCTAGIQMIANSQGQI